MAAKVRARDAGVSKDPSELPYLLECMLVPGDNSSLSLPMVGALALAQYGLDTVKRIAGHLAQSEDPARRIALAYALGKTGDRRAVPDLEFMARDDDNEVLLWAALALADIGPASVDSLANLLLKQDDLSRMVFLGDALNKIDTATSRQRLADALSRLPSDIGSRVREILDDIDRVRHDGI